MADSERPTENLFSYGTLQDESVQLGTFRRRLEGKPDVLIGYRLKMTQVEDEDFASKNGATQRTVQFTNTESDRVEGMVFKVTKKELEQADAYEPVDYRRVVVELESGTKAWVFVQVIN